MIHFLHRVLYIAAFSAICSSVFGQTPVTVNYLASTEDFANPERGFMQFTETSSGNYSPLDTNSLAFWRTLHQPFGADYSIYSTLGYRGFYLEDFTNGPISNAYLDAMQQDFDVARQAGVKLVLRFAYTRKTTPPYGDAAKSIVLQHIAQLKPLFQANADVIAVLNMGFIGAWGEGYYTDHFGFGSLSAQNWNDRTELLNALLDAMPPERSVQVRVPQLKQKAVYGAAAPPNSAPLTLAEAWQNTAKARIGFLNDCFLADETDFGTYINYDLNASGCDTCVFKPYFASDSRFVPVGGETCSDTLYPYNNCNGQAGGHAQDEMARMHFSYLNAGWNNEVNNDWVSGGCIEEIKQRIGYRFELQTSEFPAEARPGQSISIKIDLKNKGFAAPFNPRKLRFLMRNLADSTIWHVELPDDPRSWLPGTQTHTIEHSFCLPMDLPTGNYELLLQLADPYPSISARPEYAIRLANENTWEAITGYNRLLHQISVNETAILPDCAGEMCFQPQNLMVPMANFTATVTSGCVPLTVTFSNQTASCREYEWSFPGGSPANSTEPTPTVVYQTPGVFDVGLSVSNTAGTGSLLENDFIVAIPLVQVNETHRMCQGGSAICAGEEFFAPGSYPVTLSSFQGCDSVVHCNITVVPTYISQMKIVNLCFPSTYEVCDEMYDQTGIYATYCTGYLGCDSIVNIDLAVMRPMAQVAPPVALDCGSNPIVTLNGTGSNLNTATGGVTLYEWAGPGIIGANNQPIVPVNLPGQYCLILKHGRGGVYCADTACVTVSIISISPVATFANGILMSSPAGTYQWLLDGVPIPGATGQTFVPTVSGEYAVQVDCPGTGALISNAVSVVIVGVSETTLGRVKIYPNPVSDLENEVTLEMQGIDPRPFTLVLKDLAGQEILRKEELHFSENTIWNIGMIPAGSYFVQVWQQGKIVATGLFLKI